MKLTLAVIINGMPGTIGEYTDFDLLVQDARAVYNRSGEHLVYDFDQSRDQIFYLSLSATGLHIHPFLNSDMEI